MVGSKWALFTRTHAQYLSYHWSTAIMMMFWSTQRQNWISRCFSFINTADAWLEAKNKVASLRMQEFHERDVHCTAAFLPRDAMRKRGLCCRPVSVRPSVRLSDKRTDRHRATSRPRLRIALRGKKPITVKLSQWRLSLSVRAPGCKNRPAPFHGRMSYKATKPGSVCPVS